MKLKDNFLEHLKSKNQEDPMLDQHIDMSDFQIPEHELGLVDEFLSKFTIVTEQSISEHLDILLMIKALPNRVNETNFESINNFDFRIVQESLTAFQNVDLVNAFEYFDGKNRDRCGKVKDALRGETKNLKEIDQLIRDTLVKIEVNETHLNAK